MKGKFLLFLFLIGYSIVATADTLDSAIIKAEIDSAEQYINLDKDKAKIIFSQLYEKVRSSNFHFLKHLILKGQGVIYHIEGSLTEAMDYYLRALIYAKKVESYPHIATLYFNIALLYGLEGDWEKAKISYQKCSQNAKIAKDTTNLLRSMHGLAYVDYKLSNWEKAYEGFQVCYKNSLKYRNPDVYIDCWEGMIQSADMLKKPSWSPVNDTIDKDLIEDGSLGFVHARWSRYYSNFGYFNTKLSQDEIINNLKKAFTNAQKTSYKSSQITSLNLLCEKLLEFNRLDEVPQYLTFCEEALKEYESPEHEKKYLLNKSTYYHLKGEDKKSFEAANRYAQLNNIEIVEASHNIAKHIKNNKEEEVKDREILADKLKILEHESEILKKNLTYITNIISLFLFAVFVICYFVWRNSKRKRKYINILASKNKKLKDADRAKTKFIDSITHELRTPLYTINGLIELIKSAEDEQEVQEHLKTLDFSKTYLSSFVDNMVSINSKSPENFELIRQEPINIREMVKSLINSIQVIGTENEIFAHIDKKIPNKFLGDSLKMSQILFNLISNANKFTHGGEIHIRLKMQTIRNETFDIAFEIQDTGIGIDKAEQQHVFETFYRAESGKKLYEGHGIGLSVVKRMIELMGRTIRLESERGKGTTFYFTLGFRFIAEKQIVKLSANKKQTVKSKKVVRNEDVFILLVEDNRINQMIVKKIIDKKGWICTIASNGVEAVQKAKENQFTVILMDIMMPEMNGYEATREIRKFDKNVPILALTAVSRYDNEQRFKEVGIQTVIGKPVDPQFLYETIEAQIGHEVPA